MPADTESSERNSCSEKEKEKDRGQLSPRCWSCDAQFSSIVDLIHHQEIKHSPAAASSLTCESCYAGFRTQKKFLDHMTAEHGILQAAADDSCKCCDYKSDKKTHIYRHWNTLHKPCKQVPIVHALRCEHMSGGSTDCEDNSDMISYLSEKLADQLFPSHNNHSGLYTCNVCKVQTDSSVAMLIHYQKHRQWVLKTEDGYDAFGATYLLENVIRCRKKKARSPNEKEESSGSNISITSPLASPIIRENRLPSFDKHDAPHTCVYCRQGFDSIDSLYRHTVNDHRLAAVYKCSRGDCEVMTDSTSKFIQHTRQHDQSPFVCSYCNEHICGSDELITHKKSCHWMSKGSSMDKCQRTAADSRSCGKRLPEDSDDELMTQKCKTRKAPEDRICDECGASVKAGAAFYRHYKRHKLQQQAGVRQSHGCNQCEAVYNKREHLRRHVLCKHSDAKPFVCDHPGCSKAFKRRDYLTNHKEKHTDAIFTCDQCGKNYNNGRSFKYHQRSHRQEHKYQCVVCKAGIARMTLLAEHMSKVHHTSTTQPYVCPQCSQTFGRPERLRRHLESKHSLKQAWKFFCELCQVGFSGRKRYSGHIACKHAHKDTSSAGLTLTSVLDMTTEQQPSHCANSSFDTPPNTYSM